MFKIFISSACLLLTIADVYGRISEHDEKEKSQSFVNSVDEFNNLITFPFSTQFLGFTILKSKLFWKWKMAFEKSKKKSIWTKPSRKQTKLLMRAAKRKLWCQTFSTLKKAFERPLNKQWLTFTTITFQHDFVIISDSSNFFCDVNLIFIASRFTAINPGWWVQL